MNTTLSLKGGLLLALMTIIIFFIVYFLFRDGNYFIVSVRANAFIITPLYAAFAVYIVYQESGKQSSFSLLESFGLSFLTLWIGGFFSLALIFLFFNFGDRELAELLKEEIIRNWFERYKVEMIQEYGLQAYEERITGIRAGNLFNFWAFLIYLIICALYYFALSALIGLFFRKAAS